MLHTLAPNPGATKKRKRVGRGIAAGGGKTAGRGTKGQGSRTGKGRKWGFEGGQVPLLMRQPKLGGFERPRRVQYQVINLRDLEEKGEAAVAGSKQPVKLLGMGAVTKAFHVTVAAASKSAKEAITKAGGSVTIKR